MDLCTGSLADALFGSGPARLAAGAAVGIAACAGYGLCVERVIRKRTHEPSLAHAFLEGTVAVALLRLVASLLGFCNPSWVIAIGGIAAGAVAALRARGFTRPTVLMAAAVALGVPVALRQVATGMEFGDLTAIWALHAKALTCECVLTRRYVLEPCWAGTHPDYPLYLPFLHSFFFTLMGSFRDDWVKLWQALAWLAALAAIARSMGRSSPARGAAAVGALFAAAAAEHGALPFFEGFVELHSVIFAALIAAALLDDEPARLPLYLFGLAFTKHEGLVVAALLAIMIVRINFRLTLATLALLAPWLYALARLPSRHENYPARLVDAQAWSQGLHLAGDIAAGCAARLLQLPWSLALLAAAAATFFAVRRREERPLICLAAFWLSCAAFFATLLVSPWGPALYEMTLERMFLHVYPLAIFPAIVMVPQRARLLLAAACAAALVGYFVQLRGELTRYQTLAREGRTGAGWYQRGPSWPRALRFDSVLAPAARGAVLNDSWYFHLNYMLYPRVIYPTPAEQLAGTWRPWRPWSKLTRADVDRMQLSFVLDGAQAYRLR